MDSKKFLFISHITPLAKRSQLRQHLFDVMQQSLYQQNYTNWKALWIGETERLNGNIKEIAITKREDLATIYLRQDVLDYINDCDYIIKLDDDDIILPNTLQQAATLNFDCYCDEHHTFYDISSGNLTQQKRPWIAATCIHKKEHALMHQNGLQIAENFINSIFYGEHGKDWIAYYKNKNIIYTNKLNPVYVRVLSPTSITAGAKVFPLKTLTDVDMTMYYNYLKTFGIWQNTNLPQFTNFKNDLSNAWFQFAKIQQTKIKGISITDKLKAILKSILKNND